MRAELLKGIADHESWRIVEADLGDTLKTWFNRGFLELRKIDWRSPGAVLDKLIQYEAVHAMGAWSELKRRLESDRRCYAFFHPAMPDEPIIFTEVALTHGISARVQPLIDPRAQVVDPRSCDCAIFYSITNAQAGLRGLSFGNALIRQAAEHLQKELPNLRIFSTLSPVQGFRPWLAATAELLQSSALGRLMSELSAPNWLQSSERASRLEGQLVPLCAYYLLRAKQGSEPADPIARFHLSNGARLERLNWLGDPSDAGMHRSFGLTANYVYRLGDLERNHAAYTRDRRVVAARRIESLVSRGAAYLKTKAGRAPDARPSPGNPVAGRLYN